MGDVIRPGPEEFYWGAKLVSSDTYKETQILSHYAIKAVFSRVQSKIMRVRSTPSF